MPPLYWNSTFSPAPRSSISSIFRPRVRKAVSRSRSASVWKSNSISSKISMSGLKVIVVPVLFTARPFFSLFLGLPRS